MTRLDCSKPLKKRKFDNVSVDKVTVTLGFIPAWTGGIKSVALMVLIREDS